MHNIAIYLTIVAGLATLVALGIGIMGMLRKDHTPEQSNKFMRWRIAMQVIALLLFSVALLTRHH